VDGHRNGKNQFTQQRIRTGAATSRKIQVQMHNDMTCKIVKNGLSNPFMRKVATKIAEECTSTDGFKAKLAQIKNFNQRAKPRKNKTPGISQEAHTMITQYAIEKATQRGKRAAED
jgi:hypothetical protein